MDPNEPRDDPQLAPVDRLLLECVQTPDAERSLRLDALCDEHPEHADELRFRYDLLSGVGFLGDDPAPIDVDGPTAAPEQIAGYRILRRLGGGGMGEVFLAEQVSLGRRVALKLLRPEFARSDSARERFRREALALSKLDDPGICPVYEVGESGGAPYLAMRYLEGRTLAELVQTARDGSGAGCVRLSAPASGDTGEAATSADVTSLVATFERLARALHGAHEAGLVHRDIKPHNVIVTTAGVPVLVDFGLVHDDSADPGLTRSGDVVGTPAYLAPEQIDGSRPADARTDVYALGVTLYECLTLARPFPGVHREALYRQILAGECRDVRAHDRKLSADLAAVVATAMDRNPERRYRTALELAEELRRVRLHEPTVARPAGPLLRTWRWAQRNPYLASFVALVVLSLGVTSVLLLWLDRSLTRTHSIALAYAAEKVGQRDPKAGLWLALQALGIEERRETRTQVFKMLAQSHEIRRLRCEMDELVTIRFSPDDRHLLVAGSGVALWPLDGPRQPSRTLPLGGPRDWVQSAVFVGDRGERILAGSVGGAWAIWDVATGAKIHGEDEGPGIWGVDVSPDGATGLVRRTGAPFLVDVDSGARTELPHAGKIYCSAFSPDGSLVATGVGYERGAPPAGADLTVKVWQVADGWPVAELTHGEKVRSLEFLSGDELLSVSCHPDDPRTKAGTARIWSLASRRVVREQPLALAPWDADVARDAGGAPVVVISGTPGAVWWRPDRPADEYPVGIVPAGMVARSSFAPDGSTVLVGGSPPGLYAPGRGLLQAFRGHSGRTNNVAFAGDGATVATCCRADRTIRVWRVRDEVLYPYGRRAATYVEAARDGAVLHGGPDRYSIDGDAEVAVPLALALHRGSVTPVWDPGGRRVAMATDPDVVQIRDRQGNLEASFAVPFVTNPVAEERRFVVAWLDANRLLVVGHDGAMAVFDVETGTLGPPRQLDRRRIGVVNEVRVHPDGQRFVVGTHGPHAAALFDLEGRELRCYPGHRGAVVDVAFSRDGRRLATAALDDHVRLFWTDDPQPTAVVLSGHEGAVKSVAFSPDDSFVLSASLDGTARLWSVADAAEWAAIEPGGEVVRDAAFSADGRWVWIASLQGLGRWPIDLVELSALAAQRSEPDTEVDAARWREIMDDLRRR